MALDQGTTSSRCILFDHEAGIAASASQEFAQIYPRAGWVEHDPQDIWQTTLDSAKAAMEKGGVSASDIAAIGITNQRETTLIWDRNTGKCIYHAIVWQCRRTADMIDAMGDDIKSYARKKTGLIPDPYFSASKIKWILDDIPGARDAAKRGELAFGTVDSWLIWNLTGGKVHATDRTNASRTMLFDIHNMCWDEKLLDYFDIPVSMMPEVKPSSCDFGYTDEALFGVKIPICGVAGDQQSALFGQCCFESGEAKNTYGTGCFLLMNTGSEAVKSENGLLTTVAATSDESKAYALEGSVFVAGAGIQWLRDEMEIIPDAASSEVMAASVPDTNGVYIVPAFTGLGAPYWDPYARGIITGITRGCKRAHIVRAMLESLGYQTNDLLSLMEKESGVALKSLKVDGGASNNDLLMQFQADISAKTVIRPACVETTAMGAAFLAGLRSGYWQGKEELISLGSDGKIFYPAMSPEKRERYLNGWGKAVTQALCH